MRPVNTAIRVRPYRGPADHPALARIITAARAFNGSVAEVDAAQLDNDYAHLTNSDLTVDCRVVELDEQPVAYGRIDWVDRTDGRRAFEARTHVDPAGAGSGAECALLGWQLDRLEQLAAVLAAGRTAIEVVMVNGRDDASRAAIEAAGFAIARREVEMVRPDFVGIPESALAGEFEIRPIGPDDRAMHRRVFEAGVVAFRDHWGDVDDSEEGFQGFVGDPSFNPPLWRVAFHGEDIAGQVLSYLDPVRADGRRVGWTESISVQRAYRRRGLARALLIESLRAVRDAGATLAALEVDAENPNHAIDLYESLGFRTAAQRLEYHRLIVPVGPVGPVEPGRRGAEGRP